jgi:hypothetical protein
VGTALGAGISRIAGFGDYVVSDNTMSKAGYAALDVPAFGSGNNEVRITHREFVKAISVPADGTTFHNYTMDINPSNSAMFPWLSQIARNYQQYKINGMVFMYKSMTSEYASSGSLGTIGIATNYNVNDKPYSDLVSFENSQFAVVNKPSMSIVHAIECKEFARNGLQLYVRDAKNHSSAVSDPRFYDFAKVQIMTDGLPQSTDSTLGQLWVSYDITFMKPIVASGADVVPKVPRTILRSQAATTALQWLDTGDIYTDTVRWPIQNLVAGGVFKSFSTDTGVDIVSDKTYTFSRSPTELTLISPGTSGGLMLRKNGHYKLTFLMTGQFKVGEYIVGKDTEELAFQVTNVGTATSTVPMYTSYVVPHAPFSTATAAKTYVCGSGTLEVVVKDITGDSGSVSVDLAPWQVWGNSSQTPDTLGHLLYVQWSDHATLSV